MSDRSFRFGLVATPQDGRDSWLGTARRAEECGYSTLLMPDGPQLPSPWPALAAAATAAGRLRVGTFVLASPLRHPRLAAWDAHSLALISGGRFEFGIGTGRPEVVQQAAEQFGQPDASRSGERLARVEQTIDLLREMDGDGHTPILVAAGGPRARALAAAKADIVAIAASPLAGREELRRWVEEVRDAAGSRFDEIELSQNLVVVGDVVPPWVQRFLGVDPATLAARDSQAMLRGSTREMADELKRRRDSLGVSYISVNSAFFEQMAPVVELLAGR